MKEEIRLKKSRDNWKNKAVVRAEKLREARKTEKRLRNKIAELKAAVVNQTEIKKQTPSSNVVELSSEQIQFVCILLVLQGVVPYRAVPRILRIVGQLTFPLIGWIPHFTSTINWTLRLGLSRLKQVGTVEWPWLAIIDYSIDIGTKKALVVLRIPLTIFQQRAGALQLSDCECIGLKVTENSSGEMVAQTLEGIFQRSGAPAAILKDGGGDLRKGVEIWESKNHPIASLDDIGHVIANALKKQFENSLSYQRFIKLVTCGSSRLRQTQLAFVVPPKLRTKGRFQSIGKLGKWADKMLDVMSERGVAKKGGILEKLRKALPGFVKLRPFIERFARTTEVTSKVMEILKNRGLREESHQQCIELVEQLPKRSKVKAILNQWLKRHIQIAAQLGNAPLPVSTDIIESLFGKFKQMNARSPHQDMNRSVLIIPALCGGIDEQIIGSAFEKVSHRDLKQWENDEIPYTMRKKRIEFMNTAGNKNREI